MNKITSSLLSLSLRGRQLFSSEMAKGSAENLEEEKRKAELAQKRGRNEVPTGSLHKELRKRDTFDSDSEDDDYDSEGFLEEEKLANIIGSDEDVFGNDYLHSEQKYDGEVPVLATVPTRSSAKAKRGGWTPEQDEALRLAVERHDGKNWKAIAKEVPGNRTHIQCLQRWGKVLKPGLVKGPWTDEEDDLLRKWVPLEPRGNWVAVAEHIPGRTAKQCRERWSLCLDPSIRKDPWTPEEDDLLLQLHDVHGNAWATIAKYLPGRTENATKSRFKSIERKRDREWTAQEDATIIRGKAEEKKWSAIAAMMPRSKRTKHAVKSRWKELMRLNPALKRFDSGSSRKSSSTSSSSLMSVVAGANGGNLSLPQQDMQFLVQQQQNPQAQQLAMPQSFSRGLSQVLNFPQYAPSAVSVEQAPPLSHVIESEDPLDESGGAPSSLAGQPRLPVSLSSDKLMGLRIQHQNESFEEWLAREAGGIGTGIGSLPVFHAMPSANYSHQRIGNDEENVSIAPPPWSYDLDFNLV